MIDTTAQPSDASDPQEEPAVNPPRGRAHPLQGDLIETDLLVEDVSIDGMCGVY